MNSSKVLVTGGTGSLGGRVVDRLRDSGRDVRVPSRSGRPGMVWGDLSTGAGLEGAMEGVETIVHCASSPTKIMQVSLVAWLAYAAPHFVFHLGQVHHFSLFDNLAQLGALRFVALLPLVLLLLTNAALLEGKRVSQRDADPRTVERSVS